ncbi:MAG: formyltransferase family protein, partial [Sulfitobacter sp.]
MTATFNATGFSAILMGDESLTIACGDMVLAGGHTLAAVVTRDDAVQAWAEGLGLHTVAQANDLLSKEVTADWLLSIANLRLIPDAVLALSGKGAINFHDGPLPRYAGLNTPAWAIINGEATHGVSWHMIEGGVDEGDLLAQSMIDIADDETAFSLNSKCYAAGMESFGRVLAQLEGNALERNPQDLSQRSYFARDQRPEAMLDFSAQAPRLSALVRGLDFGSYWNPLTTAKVVLGGQTLCVGALDVLEAAAAEAGKVVAVSADEITIGTKTAPVVLRKLTDLNGASVDLTTLAQVGDGILGQKNTPSISKNESHWRVALGQMEPVSVPLAHTGKGAADLQKRVINCPDTLSVAQRATAVALVALRSAGMHMGDLAVILPNPEPNMANWVPLRVSADDEMSLPDLSATIEPQLLRAQES